MAADINGDEFLADIAEFIRVDGIPRPEAVGNRVTNGCGDAARTDVSASIVPATATVRCP